MLRRFSTVGGEIFAHRARFGAQFMFGRLAGDDRDLKANPLTKLEKLREESMAALKKNDMESLMSLSYKAVKWMEELPQDHPRHFPPYLTFIEEPSPFFTIFEDSLYKVFSKVGDCVSRQYGTSTVRPNNASGTAIWGARGTGKSNGLRLLTLVPPLLFPSNVVSVYYDYRSHSSNPLTPSKLLAQALVLAGVEVPVQDVFDLERVLDRAVQHNKTFVLCADEMENVYADPTIWDQFALLATRYDHTLFVADSGSKVRAMVECKGHEASLRRWFPQFEKTKLPASLNDDKLAVKELRPLSCSAQYESLLQKRDIPALRWALGNDKTTPDSAIEAVHHITGGRLRAMQRNEHVSSPATLPRGDTAAFYVLDRLRELQMASGWKSAFELVSVDEEIVLSWLEDWRKKSPHLAEKNEIVDINTLLDQNYLVMTEEGQFTFAVPDFYRQLSVIRPQVFISHAWTDGNDPMLKQLLKALKDKHVRAIIDIHPIAQNAMAECPLNDWMNRQVRNNKFVVVIMTEAYKKRAHVPGSGVHTEVALLNKHASSVRILSVSLHDCFSMDPSPWKEGQLSILGSRLVRELKNAVDIDAVVSHILNKACLTTQES